MNTKFTIYMKTLLNHILGFLSLKTKQIGLFQPFCPRISKKSSLLAFFSFYFIVAFSQQPVTSVTTYELPATPSTIGTDSWGQGNDVHLESVTVFGKTFDVTPVDGEFILRRYDNGLSTGTRCRVCVEKEGDNNASFEATYPVDANGDCSMETAMRETIVNRAALDVFHNVNNGSENANNIERIDLIYNTPLTVLTDPSLLNEAGFLATEKNGNNEYQAAVILSLDINGEPASYGPLVYIDGTNNDYGETGTNYKWRFTENEANAPHGISEGYHSTQEQVGYTLLTFQDLGLNTSDLVYGLSFFGKDVNATTHDLLDPSTFPQNTNEGADIHGGTGTLLTTVDVPIEELLNTTTAENDINQTPQNEATSGNLLHNDTDFHGDNFSIQTITGLNPSGNSFLIQTNMNAKIIYDENGIKAGSIAINAQGEYTFIPTSTFIGTVPFEYTIVDDNDNPATDDATLTIEVLAAWATGSNYAPTAHDDTNTTEQGETVTTIVLANDHDADKNKLTVQSAIALDVNGNEIELDTGILVQEVYTADGILAGLAYLDVNDENLVVFIADEDFEGKWEMDYTITDGTNTDNATLTITVEAGTTIDNDTYANDDASISLKNHGQRGNILINDYDLGGDTQSISNATDSNGASLMSGTHTLPSGGTFSITENGFYIYNPAADFVGTEVIEYVVCDNNIDEQACESATLYLTTIHYNTTYAKDDINHTPHETPVAGYVQINDFDDESDNQTYSLVSAMPAAEGTVVLDASGYYVYSPAAEFSGNTYFTYQACDDGTPQACAEAFSYITVLNHIDTDGHYPIAMTDIHTIKGDILATGQTMTNDFDPDQTMLSMVRCEMDTDNDNLLDTNVDMSIPTIVAGINKWGNNVANAGSLIINLDGSYAFMPTTGFEGKVKVFYTIQDEEELDIEYDDDNDEPDDDDSDGEGNTANTSTIPLVIEVRKAASNTTFASDDAIALDKGTTYNGNLIANDFDAEMNGVTIQSIKVDVDANGSLENVVLPGVMASVSGINAVGSLIPDVGMFTAQPDGNYEFKAAPGFTGNVVIPYTICDDDPTNPKCSNSTLTISVLDVKKDFSDAPAEYPVAWHRAMLDLDDNNIFDGATDVWLGNQTNMEDVSPDSPDGAGDDFDDAMVFGMADGDFPTQLLAGTKYDVNVNVNTTSRRKVYVGMWIDYNQDGIYDQFYTSFENTEGLGALRMRIITPDDLAATGAATVNVRLRADNNPFTAANFEGGRTNGEVEDYQTAVALPVELLYFEGESQKRCTNKLYWATTSEKNNSHFLIEYSTDSENFETIDRVEGNGNSASLIEYSYLHDRIDGQDNYYRLKQVDHDGTFAYSSIVYVASDCEGLELTSTKIYPNPTFGWLNADLVNSSDEAKDIQIMVTDVLGRIVHMEESVLEPGVSRNGIDLSNFSTGTYKITIIYDGKDLETYNIVMIED